MNITSSQFTDGGMIPGHYTCDGSEVNPPLVFSDVPAEAQSLVLIMEDPDAPRGTWLHWLIWNMDPATAGIPQGATPLGIQGVSTGGRIGYESPCPPDREHRYYFYLYALDDRLRLADHATKEEVLQAMQGHIITQAQLLGRYGRP